MRKKHFAVAVALAGLALSVAACGSDDDDNSSTGDPTTNTPETPATVQVDVGNGTPIELPTGELRVGWFATATNNEHLQAMQRTLEESADEFGWKLRVYDAAFDPAKQLNQIQNAIQGKQIDAAIVMPVDGNLACKPVTEDLPAAGILTLVHLAPICGHEVDDGPNSWEPGLLTFIGSTDNITLNRSWINAAAELNPGPQQVAMVMGPAIGAQAIAINAALDAFNADNPDTEFKVVEQIETYYTTTEALEKTKALLQANKDISLIMSVYSPDVTQGVLQALKEAGKLGQIPVADAGATKFSVEQIKEGNIQFTVEQRPIDLSRLSMQAILDAQQGKTVEKWIDDLPADFPSSDPLIITIDNVDDFTPQI